VALDLKLYMKTVTQRSILMGSCSQMLYVAWCNTINMCTL